MNPTLSHRSAGLLLHISSLPGPFGVGDLGPTAHQFVDQLARAKQAWWQMLPLGPGDSPYQCFSAMAGNPNLISPELLYRDGLLGKRDLPALRAGGGNLNAAVVFPKKQSMIARAWERFRIDGSNDLQREFERFCGNQFDWLDDFALFIALKSASGNRCWADWPRGLARRKPTALAQARRERADEIDRNKFAQFLFFRQLAELRAHAASRGIKLIGDLPIFVSGESSDVWAHPDLFLLDKNRRPTVVAGVPPDYFSATGQRWGNPLYNWPAMQRDGFRWWIARAEMALRQADLVRIDHFRGFAACWTIKASEPTAEHGKWRRAPGYALLAAMRKKLGGLPFIAEDLGVITPDVEALRDDFGLPGMRVLQFAFGADASNPFLPHRYIPNCVAYTGTHDNDTTVGWHRSLDAGARRHLRRYAPDSAKDPAWALLRLAWASVADIAIAPLQDVLRLDSSARMNTPGTISDNWAWRLREGTLRHEHLDHLAELTETYGRCPK